VKVDELVDICGSVMMTRTHGEGHKPSTHAALRDGNLKVSSTKACHAHSAIPVRRVSRTGRETVRVRY
jgi:hypothetical protein